MLLCSCSALPDGGKLDAEGKSFAARVFEEQKGRWRAEALDKYLPDARLHGFDLDMLMQRYSESLGEPISSSAFNGTYKVQAGINVPDFQGAYQAELLCTKGKGTINLSVAHKDGRWYLTTFNVCSSKLQPQDNELRVFVHNVGTLICQNWRIEDLRNNGSKLFQKQLLDAEIPMKTMLAGGRALGAFRSIKSEKFLGIGEHHGVETFSYELNSEYERGAASMLFTVTKEGTQWKLAGFHFQARTGSLKP